MNILVPIGTSENAHETLQYATDFAADFGAQIYVMEVFNATGKAGTLTNVTQKIAESGKERLKEVISKVETRDKALKIVSFNGELPDGLMEIDKELGIDLIILAPKVILLLLRMPLLTYQLSNPVMHRALPTAKMGL